MNWHDNLDHVRTCDVCGDEFIVTKGEAWFASVNSLSLPVRCKWHRPSRREQLDARRGETGAGRPS